MTGISWGDFPFPGFAISSRRSFWFLSAVTLLTPDMNRIKLEWGKGAG
jgi:hypothetical protein